MSQARFFKAFQDCFERCMQNSEREVTADGYDPLMDTTTQYTINNDEYCAKQQCAKELKSAEESEKAYKRFRSR